MIGSAQEPRVWIVSAEHWPRALLRAELIERGFDAVGFVTLKDAIVALTLPRSRPPALVVVDLHKQIIEQQLLERLLRAKIPMLAIADATRSTDEGIRRSAGCLAESRLCVYFSGKHVYAQVVDDEAGRTLVCRRHDGEGFG